MTILKDLLGKTFGRLTVLKRDGSTKWKCAIWLCQCSCGKTYRAPGTTMIRGRTQSCGCLMQQHRKNFAISHGLSDLPEYNIWHDMKRRCYTTTSKSYANYGGRGIRVCASWLKGFTHFYRDMGPRPSPDHTIERIDNNGNYRPKNCKWATRAEQGHNKRTTRWVHVRGQRYSTTQACRIFGVVKPNTAIIRLNKGWSDEAAVLTPPLR